ncbi:MAG: NUDIX domain-containing protein [Chloroflexia bacterium]
MSYDNRPEQAGWAIFRVGQGILVEDDRVLLAGNRWFSGKPLVWTLPGGRADDGEGLGEALVREFAEETGLSVEVLDLAFVAEARSSVHSRLFLTCAFTVKRMVRDSAENMGADVPAPPPGDAVEDLRFVPVGELDNYLTSPSLRDPLAWYLEHPNGMPRYWFFPEYSAE